MKNLVAFLGCGVLALAIGCGDSKPAPVAPSPAMTPEMMKNMSGANAGQPAGADSEKAADAGEKKEDPAAEKKEEAPAEKKEEAPAEKKEEAGEKKE